MVNMTTFIVGIVIVGITLVIGIYIASQIGSQMTAESAEANAASDLVDALSAGTPWITILVVVGFSVIVLGMLIGGLGRASEGSGPTY